MHNATHSVAEVLIQRTAMTIAKGQTGVYIPVEMTQT